MATLALVLTAPRAGAQCLQNKLLSPHTPPGTLFGEALDADGDVLVVGARLGDTGVDPNGDEGLCHVFRRVDGAWLNETLLFASDGAKHDGFGKEVAIDGPTLIVGAYGDDDGGSAAGAVYIYTFDGSSWGSEVQVLASKPNFGSQFGWSVDLSGERFVAGLPQQGPGAVEVYAHVDGEWAFQQQLTVSGGESTDDIGRSVSIDGDTLLVGAPGDSDFGLGAGAVYAYHWDGSAWQLEQKLLAPSPAPGDAFGFDVELQGALAVVSAPHDSVSGATDAGSAFIYDRSGGRWTLRQQLISGDPAPGDRFGCRVDLDGDVLAIGESEDDLGVEHPDAGAAWRFEWDGVEWVNAARLAASDPGADMAFGAAVAVTGDLIAVGSPQGDAWGGLAGAVYSFEADPAFSDLGFAMAGTNGTPCLWGQGSLDGGTLMKLGLTQAKPLSQAILIASLTPLLVAFKGGVLVPFPDIVIPGLLTNLSGELALATTWPGGVPAGISLYVQYWIPDPAGLVGFAASNALRGITP